MVMQEGGDGLLKELLHILACDRPVGMMCLAFNDQNLATTTAEAGDVHFPRSLLKPSTCLNNRDHFTPMIRTESRGGMGKRAIRNLAVGKSVTVRSGRLRAFRLTTSSSPTGRSRRVGFRIIR